MGVLTATSPRSSVFDIGNDTTIARAESPRGEVVLRRRSRDGALELRVNGVFVMDSRETGSERALASLALERLAQDRSTETRDLVSVLVGGLGLGYTLAEFAASPLVGEVVVAEIEAALVDWHLGGLITHTADIIRSSPVRVVVGDVRDVLATRLDGSLDAIVLDVDNGPGFLVYGDNAPIYRREFLSRCRQALADKGVVVVWSAAPASGLRDALHDVFGSVSHHPMEVTLGQRVDSYHAYVAPGTASQEPPCPSR
jgi:spermidine synthase